MGYDTDGFRGESFLKNTYSMYLMVYIKIATYLSMSKMANAQVRVTMVDTVRGGQHLFYERFKFRCKKTVREKKYWNCVVAACRASVITENGILQAALQVNHTHQPIRYEMEVASFKTELIHCAKTETTPIPAIYGDERYGLQER
ncbi:uncharacterized protein LOC125377075 [Haliotis rufescens]|uniref:uncharacterized protein LOC125377075 n=1 Tax=Haliotis rufescens TaxID=6454 RepID=UPI00201F6F91|nr:uncharacterized protein LOC125377075 [Haliotis rufescens]